jgi:C4-dicarboxylate-specific signal transduction histidine kinase
MANPLYKFFFSLSFRTHLVLMVLLLSLPAIALISYSGFQQRRDAINDGITETKMLVHSILTEQYNMTGDAEQLVTTLAQLSDVKDHKVAATNAILSNIIKLNHEYSNIFISDGSGDIWASALPYTTRLSVRDNRSFQNAIKTRHFSSGEYGVGRISGKPNLGFGYPIINKNGKVAGVILASVDFEYLNDLLVETGLPKGSSFTLTDCRGVIIYKNLNSVESIGTRLDQAIFRQMQRGADEVSFLDFGPAADQRITSSGKLRLRGEESPYLYVKAGIPLQETLVKARHAQLVNLALLSPVLLVAILLATLLGKFCFVNRIKRLKEASQRLARGDLTARVCDLLGGGELGELGRSFDEMAHRLAARELELVRLNQSLSNRVEEETLRRLQQERLLARHARLAAIGEMIGAIAHQWRQPLATLGATIQSLRMAWERQALDGPFLERAEADAQKQLYYMSDTIEDFKNFFSPEKVIESFDVKEKIHEVSLLVAAQFANSGVSLELSDDEPGFPMQVQGYQNEFKQSVLNLVSNAFDAVVAKPAPAEGAGAAVERRGLVVISLSRVADSVVIEVRDNGCGIAPEVADKVYEPYFTSKPKGKGTGIGLYMSKLIIEESMGGTLGFTSLPDGTVFRILLPQKGREEDVTDG